MGERRTRVEQAGARLAALLANRLARGRAELSRHAEKLEALSPLAVLGRGDHIVVTAADYHAQPLELLLLGGLPLGAPIEHYGPFVMNTREEIVHAIEDYQSGRLGIIPPDQLEPRNFA